MLNNHQNHHVEYMDVTQHWDPRSEQYTGGDALITALFDGWEMNNTVHCETKWYGGMRFNHIYRFELSRNGETRTMPVITNPFVDRFILQSALQLMQEEC